MTTDRFTEIQRELTSRADPEAARAQEKNYGIPADHVYGVPMREMKKLAADIGTDHALAEKLWDTGNYESRTIAAFIADPVETSIDVMDRWCRDSDSWALVDTLCFRLFDRAPERWSRLEPWARDDELYVKRAAFALLWALALHDKDADDHQFVDALALVREHADDDRHLVTKAQTMALRAIVSKRPAAIPAVSDLVADLVESPSAARRRVGRPILKLIADA